MEELIAKLRLLVKAETILVRLHLRRAVKQVSLILVAALFGLIGLAMLNVALYFSLTPQIGPAPAALVVAGLNLLFAIIAVIIAGRLGLGAEADAAESIRDIASTELATEAERLRSQLDDLGHDIKRMSAAVTGITQPGGIGLPTLFQWLMTLVSYLRRKQG